MTRAKKSKLSTKAICALCRAENVTLCNSHIVPAGLYKLMEPDRDFIQQGGSRDPIHFLNGKAYPWSKQARQPLLCRPCEERLNRDETYVLPLLFRFGEEFGLRNLLEPLPPQPPAVFLRTTPMTVDAPALTRFALGMMWRASAATIDAFANFDLGDGPEEEARLHLLGLAAWPTDIVMEMVVFTGARDLLDLATMCMPQATGDDGGDSRHFFWFGHGIRFDFTVGPNLPSELRELCFWGGGLSRIIMTHADTYGLGDHIVEKFQTHTPSGSFGAHLQRRFGSAERR